MHFICTLLLEELVRGAGNLNVFEPNGRVGIAGSMVDNEKGSQMAHNGCMPATPLETGQNGTVLLGVVNCPSGTLSSAPNPSNPSTKR